MTSVSSETRGVIAVATAVGLLVLSMSFGAVAGPTPIAVAEPAAETVDSRVAPATETTAATAVASNVSTINSTRLSGTVTDENGEPILKAVVNVAGGPKTTTNSNGFYTLELEPGDHEITVSGDEFEPETWNESLSEGEWTQTDVTLSFRPTELEGTVTNPDGEPIENATVRVVDGGTETTTDENGSYAFALDAGRYTLETSAVEYETKRTAVTLEEYRTTTENIVLSKPDGADEDDENESSESDGTDEDGTDDGGEGDTGDEDAADTGDEEVEADGDEPTAGREPRRDSDDPETPYEQVLTMLFFAGTFLTALVAAATVGLYRDRSQQSRE